MRGVSKPWPPKDVYPDGHTPVSLSDAESAYLAVLPGEPKKVSLARSEFDRLEKRKLRREMYREQSSLCIYCEREIAEGTATPRIDHWRPLSFDPTLALHWDNLYLSCSSPETCDAAKGDRLFRWDAADPHMPWPVHLRYEDIVGFTSRGEIYVRSDVALSDVTRRALRLAIEDRPDGDGVRRGIVNLNHPALVEARAAAVDSERTRLKRDFRNRTATRDQRDERATRLFGKGTLPAFVSIRVTWLRKQLGRGR